MRCIEIQAVAEVMAESGGINRNMRCIEILLKMQGVWVRLCD